MLFDLTVLASIVAAVYLWGCGFGKPHPVPEQATTESKPYAIIENQRQQQKLHWIKLDVMGEKTRLRDNLVAGASTAVISNVPLTIGEEEFAEVLSQADKVLLQIEISKHSSWSV